MIDDYHILILHQVLSLKNHYDTFYKHDQKQKRIQWLRLVCLRQFLIHQISSSYLCWSVSMWHSGASSAVWSVFPLLLLPSITTCDLVCLLPSATVSSTVIQVFSVSDATFSVHHAQHAPLILHWSWPALISSLDEGNSRFLLILSSTPKTFLNHDLNF